MSKPRKQTIEKYTKFLEKLSKHNTISKPDFYQEIKEFRLNNGMAGPMIALGYIEPINGKTFKVCLLKVMPIHAVELLYRLNSSRKMHKAATLTKTITASNSKNTPLKKLKAVVVDSELKQPRQFSILWGMLMIKW
jgi:hypothetical protein